MALVFLRLYSLNFNLALVFGGASSIVIGSLILRATFVPRIIGPLMILDGLGYFTFSLAPRGTRRSPGSWRAPMPRSAPRTRRCSGSTGLLTVG
jgi:hypothetical protein